MDGSRKRKHSDGAATFPSRDLETVTRTVSGPQRLGAAGVHSGLGSDVLDERRGHTYTSAGVSGEARAHFGDNITLNNHGSRLSEEAAEKERLDELMKALAFDRMDFRQAAIKPAHAGTCRWIFQQPEYLRWRDPAQTPLHHGFFWIKGKPGSGKSTMMKCVLEHIQHETLDATVISFFFNARGAKLERTTAGCYRSLLHQLLDRLPSLFTIFGISGSLSKDQELPLQIAQDWLRRAILQLRRGHLFLIVDALDECHENEIRDMVEFFSNLSAEVSELKGVKLSVCYASRHYPNITTRYCEKLVVEDSTDHAHDISAYIWNTLNVASEKQRLVVQEALMQRSQAVFLWVVLVVRILNKRSDRGAILYELLSAVEDVPGDLDDLIERIIGDGPINDCFLPALLWTLAGPEQTFIERMYVGVQLGAGRSTLPRMDRSEIDVVTMKQFILHSSKGLLEVHIINDHHACTVQFIHESVRQHVLNGGLGKFDAELSQDVGAVSHAKVAAWCQEYVRLDVLSCFNFPADEASGMIAWDQLAGQRADPDYVGQDSDRERILAAFPLLEYVQDYTLHHLNMAYVGGVYSLDRLATFPIKSWINTMNAIEMKEMVADPEDDYEPDYISSSASLLYLFLNDNEKGKTSEIVGAMIKHLSSCCGTVQTGKPASRAKADSTCDVLFGQSLDDDCGGFWRTPLSIAVARGHLSFAQQLLDCGADIHAFSNTRSSIAASVGSSDIEMVKLLLERGVRMDMQTEYGRESALATATGRGHKDIVELLLEHDADINLEDSYGNNIALWSVVENGHREGIVELLQLLFERGAHPGAKAMSNLFDKSTHDGLVNIMNVLAQHGALPTSKDQSCRTTLHRLAERVHGYDACVPYVGGSNHSRAAKALLDLGVSVNAVGGEYDTALIAASARGCVDFVRVLLDSGADLHHRSNKYGTAIEAARAAGHGKIVDILSEASRTE